MGRARSAALLLAAAACSPSPNFVEAEVVGPEVVLDADTTSRSFVVHPCYASPERLDSLQMTIEAEARATRVGENDPWVRILVEPVQGDDVDPDLVDARVTEGAAATLSIEHALEGSALFDAGLCEDGMAVVTFELVDPSGGGRVEIDWDAALRGSVFTDEEAFDVHVEG